MTFWYKLTEDHRAVPATRVEANALLEDTEARIVVHDEIDGVQVSTVFLVLNMSHGDGAPMLFETMIFGGPKDGWQTRCSTWDEALRQHAEALKAAGYVRWHTGELGALKELHGPGRAPARRFVGGGSETANRMAALDLEPPAVRVVAVHPSGRGETPGTVRNRTARNALVMFDGDKKAVWVSVDSITEEST